MTYTQAALLAVVATVVLDLLVLRTLSTAGPLHGGDRWPLPRGRWLTDAVPEADLECQRHLARQRFLQRLRLSPRQRGRQGAQAPFPSHQKC